MGRYKVFIEKFVGSNPEKSVTRIEVSGYLSKAEDTTAEVEVTEGTVDLDGNVTSVGNGATVALPILSSELVRLASFDVTNPVARFIKIVTCCNSDPSKCVVWEAISGSKSLKEEKSVQILHRRKSAGRVRSFSEATSIILRQPQKNFESEADLERAESDSAEPLQPEKVSNSTKSGKAGTFRIDLHDLKNTDKVTLRVDTDRESVDYEGGTTVVKVINGRDENGNAHHNEETPEEEPHCSTSTSEPCTTINTSGAEVKGQEVTDTLEDSPITMNITIANDLMICVELDNNFDRICTTETGTTEISSQSLVEPDTVFYLPYQDVFLAGLPASRGSVLPAYLKEKNQPERLERKKLLRKMILERLLAFGTPNVTAYDIMDTWYSGYVQHRALSYRIPKMRVVSKEKSDTKKVDENDRNRENLKPVQIKIGNKLPESSGFIEAFIYHANYLKGILNSATCTALESTFYLMIPHFKTQTEKDSHCLPGAGISPTFIRDWIFVLKIAAYQLKPTEPSAITDMVKKETKVMKRLFDSIHKQHKKMKERLHYIRDKVEILKEKTYERIKLDNELALEIQQDEEPVDYAGFAHLQIVGFTGPEIFPKYLHFLTGKYGLFLKKEASEAWFPFSDLNFLERRVIYLGLMDHFHSSFESVLTTLSHLQEIYTPGYPMNLLTRFKPLYDLLGQPKPYQLLATESKLALYAASCGCVGALKRFTCVYKELIRMVKDARHGLEKFDYSDATCAEFAAKLGMSERMPKLNLIVPFATLNLEGFAHLSQRGTSVPVEEPNTK